MLPTFDIATFKLAGPGETHDFRGLIRTGRRILKRCWLDQHIINQPRIFCQNSGACGSTYLVKLLKENGIERVFHEKGPDLNQIGLDHFEKRLSSSRLVKLLRYTRHDVFFEANNRLFSMTQEIGLAFPFARFIHLHRDGSEAVRSAMSKPQLHRYVNGNVRFMGSLAGSHSSEPFVRLCHYWANINRRILDDLELVASRMMDKPVSLRFEDLINGRVEGLEKALGTALRKKTCRPANVGPIRDGGKFPRYAQWTKAEKRTFDEICGPVMVLLGR